MMHYDKKISCALGILLIGIVTALFFRHEKTEATEVPALENPQSLDAKIAKKSVRPYDTPSRLSGVIEEAAENGDSRSGRRPYEELPESDTARVASDGADTSSTERPKPIETGSNASSGVAGTANARHNSEWNAVARDKARPASRRNEIQRTYKVRDGDTLSGIAYRFLGRSARFNEIFEANRVLLRSPDDLRAGMTLRIPPRRRRTNAVVVKSSEPNDRTSTTNSTERKTLSSQPPANGAGSRAETSETREQNSANESTTRPKSKRRSKSSGRRFIPIHRPPFRRNGLPVRTTKVGTDETSQPRGRRTLSQTSPKDNAAKSTSTEFASTSDRPDAKPIMYTVRRGDTLERIALRYYGRTSAIRRILNVNRGRIRDPNVLRPGTRLLLPRP